MRASIRLSAIAILALLCGCSNHPLQDDVTGYTTHDIVQKLRCEAQAAVLKRLRDKKVFPKDYHNVVLRRYRDIKEDAEWRAANKTALSQIDKEVEQYNTTAKANKDKFESTKSAVAGISREIAGVNAVLKDPDQKHSEATREKLNARIEMLFQRAAVLTSKLRALVGEREKIKKDGMVLDYKHDIRLGNLQILPPRLKKEGKLTSEIYAEYREYTDKLDKGLKSPEPELKLLGDRPSEFNDHNDSKSIQSLFSIYRPTLAMKLDFKITESNNAIVDGSLTWPIQLGSVSLAYKAGKERERVAQRVVNITSLFQELADEKLLKCPDDGRDPEDKWARTYPIVGNVGVGELIEQYFRILESTTIPTGEDKFTDTLTFTTKLTGKLNPTIEIKPVHPSLVKGGLDLNAGRHDVHAVTMQLRPYSPPSSSSDPKLQITKIPNVTVNITEGQDGHGTVIDVR